jgi:hypothetical protein
MMMMMRRRRRRKRRRRKQRRSRSRRRWLRLLFARGQKVDAQIRTEGKCTIDCRALAAPRERYA